MDTAAVCVFVLAIPDLLWPMLIKQACLLLKADQLDIEGCTLTKAYYLLQ